VIPDVFQAHTCEVHGRYRHLFYRQTHIINICHALLLLLP
jgi:hypothetical protein